LPPSVEQVAEGLRRVPEALAVLSTSPTYEGLTADTRGIAAAVHGASPNAMVIVDEAWGGHLNFHPSLPESAMAAGADVCVQSTHKLARGLQQTGPLHWLEGRVDSELMEEAYREDVTTSPSYHLLASADAAVRTLVVQGEEALGRAIERTEQLKAGLRVRLPDLDWMDDAAWLRSLLCVLGRFTLADGRTKRERRLRRIGAFAGSAARVSPSRSGNAPSGAKSAPYGGRIRPALD
jgi:arginine decarboxylase